MNTVFLSRGFTIIELLVVMAILAILAAAAMPLGETLSVAARERELKDALWTLRHALDDYKAAVDQGRIARTTQSGYPAQLADLVQGVPPAASSASAAFAPDAARLYFLRQVPRDPFADAALPAAATWKLRSYASPPDHPEPGADVYDVHSSSPGTALDGSAYAQW